MKMSEIHTKYLKYPKFSKTAETGIIRRSFYFTTLSEGELKKLIARKLPYNYSFYHSLHFYSIFSN
jgi:hypothetical protein